MKKILPAILVICLVASAFGQGREHQALIRLAKAYDDFMFRNEPSRQLLKELRAGVPGSVRASSDFILEAITAKNKLLTRTFLTLPDEAALKQVFIIRAIRLNRGKEGKTDVTRLIDSLSKNEISRYELIDNYYGMLFAGVGNKNQPFDLSRIDLSMDDYNLENETEKGILFLRCMDLCGTTIWGYMNIAQPANTQKAYRYIRDFPKINGQPYYQYNDLYFKDFEMNIIKDKGLQSYKHYYINKYYQTLLYHLICLNKEGGTEKEKNDLLLGSILKERSLYKYSEHREVLESIFQVQKENKR